MLKKKKREKLPKVKKEKKIKKKHIMGPIEFIFNFISLVFMLGVALYFGGRSLYYYSKQNVKIKEEAMTVNGLIVQNNIWRRKMQMDFIKIMMGIILREMLLITML